MAIDDGVAGASWTVAEVEATVGVYFQMLRMQELGQTPNKTEHNRRLQALLPVPEQGLHRLQAPQYQRSAEPVRRADAIGI